MSARIEPSRARDILAKCKAAGNFHALPRYAVDSLLEEARAHGYRKSKNAPGSTARMFHGYLTRQAESLTANARESIKGRNATVTLKRGRRSVTVSSFPE